MNLVDPPGLYFFLKAIRAQRVQSQGTLSVPKPLMGVAPQPIARCNEPWLLFH